ncbi:MAG: serine O-acetyltransferase [Defluviicoccus sp.]|nr:MAG: serine O-acetyltransferase [Defluviicoccus sp.]
MVFKHLREDLDAFMARDPAARSRLEIVLCYPGFHALLHFRLASALWHRGLCLPARLVSQISRLITGIEIHPGATIGRRVVIDHGFGVVIGETAEIDDDVTLYHAVTLGGIAPSVDSRAQVNVKRHPTLRSGVIVGSGAQILGPIVIGERARVGANSVVTRDVLPGETAVGIPAHTIRARDRGERFSAYGTPAGGCPDPVQATVDILSAQVSVLVERVEQLQHELEKGSVVRSTPIDGKRPNGAIPEAADDEAMRGAERPSRIVVEGERAQN